jgi:hypothetical protein
MYGQVPDNQGKHINTTHPVLRAPFFNAEGKEFINNEVKELQCGNEHCLALTKGGDVWSFGRNDRVLPPMPSWMNEQAFTDLSFTSFFLAPSGTVRRRQPRASEDTAQGDQTAVAQGQDLRHRLRPAHLGCHRKSERRNMKYINFKEKIGNIKD